MGLAAGEGLVEVADQVFGAFEADRQADHVGAGAGCQALLVAELAVGGRSGVQNQAAGIADIGEVREQLDVFDQLYAGFVTALDPEREDRPGASRQVFAGQAVKWAMLEPRIGNPANPRVLGKKFSHFLGILDMAVHPQRQGLDPGNGQERVHRRQRRPEIP